MRILQREIGRKRGFSFGVPRLVAGGKIRQDQKDRAGLLADRHRTRDEILRAAIDLGLPILEQRDRAIKAEVLGGDPAKWE